MSQVSNFIKFSYNKINNLEKNKKISFYILLFMIFLTFINLIPSMILKTPCRDAENDDETNCSVMYELDNFALMEYNQSKFLGLYSMNIVTTCLCFILSIVLMVYILK